MAKTERLQIDLPADLAQKLREEVAMGRFASDSELIGSALRSRYFPDRERSESLQHIRAMLDEALNDPRPSRTDGEVAKTIEALHRATVSPKPDAA